MFLDPDKLQEHTPAEILDALSRGHLGPDHRFLKALLNRKEETLKATAEFTARDRSEDTFDCQRTDRHLPLLQSAGRHSFLIKYIKEDPENVPDEVVVGVVNKGNWRLSLR